MNHLLHLLNINISSSNDKRDLIIALFVVLFFGVLLWWLLNPSLNSNNLPLAADASGNEKIIPALINNEGEDETVQNTYIATQNDNVSEEQGQEEQGQELEQIENNTPEVILEDTEKRILVQAVENVAFKENTAELLRSSRPSLYRIAKIMKKYPDYQLSIVAYTAVSEKELAENRAKICFDYLVNEEIESDRISYKGKEYEIKSDPTNLEITDNDRVEFDLSY